MGKLHKLRRNIEKNPERWIRNDSTWYALSNKVMSARLENGHWQPVRYSFEKSYKHFVESVLESLGYKVG